MSIEKLLLEDGDGLLLQSNSALLLESSEAVNVIQAWRGAVEPAESGASGNEVQLWRGAVEPAGATDSGSNPGATIVDTFAPYAVDPILGVDPYGVKTRSSIEFRPGTIVRGRHDNTLIYVYANEDIASGTGVELGASFTASASAGGVMTALYAISSGEYGWVAIGDVTTNS